MKKNYYLRGFFVCCSFLLLLSSSLNAQFANQYSFTAASGTFTPLVGGTATSLALTEDDAIANNAPIGFDFVYNSQVVTNFRAASNGYVSLLATGTSSTGNDLATTTATLRSAVAPLWDDIQCTAGVTYQLSGSAPNRVLTIEYRNMEWNYAADASVISFQVKLYETTNVIEFIYQQEAAAYNAGFSGGASIGIMGSGNTDFISLQDVTAAPAISTTTSKNDLAAKPATGQIYRFTPPTPPAAPATLAQAPGTPDCITGTELTLSGTPGANETWYWQTTATGTSTANPHVAPHNVFGNGTYYVRAFNSVTGSWSAASSITVSNFTFPAAPAAPTASQNPACFTTGSTISAPTAPGGEAYYWQGTTALGTSTANNAATPMNISTSGTYYVRAYNTTTQCWSLTAGSIVMNITSFIPAAPTANPAVTNICSGATSAMLNATPPPTTGSVTVQIGSNLISSGDAPTTIPFNAALPAGVTVTSAQLQLSNVNATNGSWRSEIRVAITGAYTLGATQISALNSGGPISPDPTINLTGFPSAGGAMNVVLSESYNDFGVDDASFGNIQLVINYTTPPSTISWYDLPTGGTLQGTGSPFNAVGTSALDENIGGSYSIYAESNAGCAGTSRTLFTINVTEVLAVLNPVNIPCNGGNTGSFTLGTVQCGNPPFLYSVNGGAFGAIPTNLLPGTYSVVMQDATMGTSAPISVVITQPAAPSSLTATNVTFYDATLGWTTTGNESSWTIIYGPTGFDPATSGTLIPNATNTYTLDNVLTPSTTYDYYVFANCGPHADTSGPVTFTTLSEFYTWDGDCGPGFTDISATGTNANLTDDMELGVTLPWAWTVNGTTVNTITIGNNGGVLFNTLTGNVGYDITSGNGFYPYSQDLNTANAGGGVFYQSIGTAPNRQFVILWKDLPHYNFPVATDGATFELIHDEATGETYFVYQDVMMGNGGWDNGADAEIAAVTPNGTVNVSMNSAAYLGSGNTCVHFYSALCPNVQNMVTLVTTEDAQLNWDAGQYGETDWTVVYGLDGFDPSIASQVLGTLTVNGTSDAFISNLEQLTCYDAYIYSECTADNLISNGYLVNFCTKPDCADITSLAGATDVDSLELTWAWTPSSVSFPVTGFNIQYGMTGFTLGSGDMVSAAGINFADTIFDADLMGSGVYQVYVQAECDMDTSNWVGPITVIMPVSNDVVCSQEVLDLNTVYTFNNAGAGVSPNESNIAPPAAGAQSTTGWVNATLNGTLWYTFVAPPSGSVRVNSTAINYNGQAAVYSATNCADFNTFTLLAANDDAIGGTSMAPNFTVCDLTPGATYYIMYDKFDATSGTFSLRVTEIVLDGGNALPLTNICYGSNLDLFTTISGNNPGGTWSSAIPSVNASITGSDFESNGLAYTTFDFQYRVIDGCAYDSIVSQVKIFAPSNAGQDGTITACKNEPIDLLSGLNGNTDLNGDWYDPSDVLMPNSQVTTANFGGQYNFDYISGNGVCPDDTANVVVTVLGNCDWTSVDEIALEEVSLYPNPSTGVVFIESAFAGNFDLVVTDINGRTIETGKNILSGTNTVNLKEVERGTYFFKLSTENAEKVFRVVIQ